MIVSWGSTDHREVEVERAPVAGRAADGDVAAVLPDERPRERESNTGPLHVVGVLFADLFEVREQLRLILLLDADPRVAHRNVNP